MRIYGIKECFNTPRLQYKFSFLFELEILKLRHPLINCFQSIVMINQKICPKYLLIVPGYYFQ